MKGKTNERERTSKWSIAKAGMAVLLAALAVSFLTVTPVMAQETETTVTVNAPEYVVEGETFDVTIDVDYVEEFNSAQFDLSFDPSVVDVTDVTGGRIDDTGIPIYYEGRIDSGTIKKITSGFPEEVDTKVSGTGYLAKITFEVIGAEGDECVLEISNGELVKIVKTATGMDVVEEIPAEWIDAEIRIGVEEEPAFDTGPGTYPSIFGTHEGTIEVYDDIAVEKLYTYPCEGTGGHTEYVRIWGNGIDESASWSGYTGDWYNISFSEPFVLYVGEPYSYIIETGSYPQIIHEHEFYATGGTITCDTFMDANGREYNNWIPAIKLC